MATCLKQEFLLNPLESVEMAALMLVKHQVVVLDFAADCVPTVESALFEIQGF